MRRIVGAVICLVCAFAMSAQAGVVYSQPYGTDMAAPSDVVFPQFMADDFTLAADYAITDVHWWGGYGSGGLPTDSFTIMFYPDGPGPGLAMAIYNPDPVSRTFVQHIPEGWDIYHYSYDLPVPLNLSGGLTYYLGIYNNTVGQPGPWEWLVDTTATGNGGMWFRVSLSDPYFLDTAFGDLSFEITVADNVIPEPISAFLFGGSVLLGLGRLRRRLS